MRLVIDVTKSKELSNTAKPQRII